ILVHVVHGKFAPRCSNIHNPIPQLMHKWLTITLFPRDDVRPVRNDELLILYAMVNKIKISPAQTLVEQLLLNLKMTDPIECTSLITRIATRIGVLEGNFIPFIKGDRAYI